MGQPRCTTFYGSSRFNICSPLASRVHIDARLEDKSMKTKLLALLFLVGSAAFAAPRVAIGVGVGIGPAYGYAAPAPAVAYVAPAPVYWGPRAYYGPRWVGPRYFAPRYYGPRY